MLLQQSGSLPSLCIAVRNRSAQSVIDDIKNNSGYSVEAALKGISEEELEIRQQELDDNIDEEVTNESLSDVKKIFSDLSKLVNSEALKAVDMLSPTYGLNEDIAEYLVSNRVNALWSSYINGEEEAVIHALNSEGGYYFTEIKRRFLTEKDAVESLPIPLGWSFKNYQGEPCQPFLMQRWTAWQVQKKQRVGNWSGVGAGKTLSAILASRVIDARVTLIVANSATINEQETINGWKRQILNAYPNSVVHTHENVKKDLILSPDRYHYILLNYEKFQQEGENRSTLIEVLLGLNPNFIVLDEIHFVKQRGEHASNRREALEYLVHKVAEANPSLHMLGMSATPVINNLQEAKKLLEIVTGEIRPDIGTVSTINNALTLHRLLMLHGLRYRPRYEQEMPPLKLPEVHNKLLDTLQKAQRSILATEQVLFSRVGFLVRLLGKRAGRKRFGGLSWTSSASLGSSSGVGQTTDVGSQSYRLLAELSPRMLALCLSHQWSKLAYGRISNSCYLLALLYPLMHRSLLSGMQNEPAHRVALYPGYSSLS